VQIILSYVAIERQNLPKLVILTVQEGISVLGYLIKSPKVVRTSFNNWVGALAPTFGLSLI